MAKPITIQDLMRHTSGFTYGSGLDASRAAIRDAYMKGRIEQIGGGISGMTAALALADQGFKTHLIEKSDKLGGNFLNLHYTLEHEDVSGFLSALIKRACGLSPGPGGFLRKSARSLPAQNESPAPCQSTTRI